MSDAEKSKKIHIIDDEPYGLESILRTDGFEIDSSRNPHEGLKKLLDNNYDLLLLDLIMPEMEGLNVLKTIRNSEKTRTLPIIILSNARSENNEARSLQVGADDVISKSSGPQTILARIKSLLRRVEWDKKKFDKTDNFQIRTTKSNELLTSRQIEILNLMSKGYSNKEIADELFISETTIKAHLRTIFKKLKVTNRTQAVLYSIQKGFDV